MGKFNHIPELTGASIFQTWKAQIILALGCKGVYNHISNGTDPTDIAEFTSVMPTPTATALTTAEKKLIQDWLKDDTVAKDIICHHLSHTVQQRIPQERSSTARDAWKLLHSLFDHVDLGSQYLVCEKIFGLQMKDAKDAQCYLGEHETLCRDLVQMGVAYSDSEAVFNLLKGLPHTGTWPAFKLMLQTSISTTASTIPTSASGSSISQILSTTQGTTFENVSACIAAEAHRQLLESSLISPLGTGHAHAIMPPSGHRNNSNSLNPVMNLRHTRNNPFRTYCNTPLRDGSTCRAFNHDQAHCFKPGGGMAGQQPAHWRQPQGRGKSAPSATALIPTAPAPVPTSAPLTTFASVPPSNTWATRDYNLSCVSIIEVGDDSPSKDILACLTTPGNTCLLDSGTSHNLICDWAHLPSYSVDDSVRVQTANHGYLLTSGSSECISLLNVGGHKHKVKFSGCLHAPGAMLNLLSMGWMLSKGWDCHFCGGPCCDLSYRTSPLGSIPLQNNLCFLDLKLLRFDAPLPLLQEPAPLTAFTHVAITPDLWHAHLGHVGGEAAQHGAHFADGITVTTSTPLSVCESCIVGKHPCQPFPPSEEPWSSAFLDLVHADVAGPMPVCTPLGHHYFLVILDDFTHVLDLHLLTTKDQALDAWESTRHRWETKCSRRVKSFQSDNGGEFIGSSFVSALNAAGISHRLSAPYMHQQNGVAERIIHTIEGCLLAMLHLAGLPQMYWGEAALTAAYLHNQTESCVLPPGRTPYEMLHGQCPNLSHLHIWGCCAFARVPLELQGKLGPKLREVLFMGYPPGVKGYRVRDIKTGQFFNSCDIIFDEKLGLPHLTGEAPASAVVDNEDNEDDGGGDVLPATPPSPPASVPVVPAPSPGFPLRHSS